MNRRSVALVALLIALPAAARADEVRCESKDGREAECPIDTSAGVSIVRQLSDTGCVEGRTWGVRRRSVWVKGGCRAIFATQASDRRLPTGRLPTEITCKSNDFRRTTCPLDTRGGVRLSERLSSAECVRDRSWGVLRDGVFVTDGCEARFVSGGGSDRDDRGRDERGRDDRGLRRDGPVLATRTTCESENRTQVLCRLDARDGVRLVRRLSAAQCVEGESWGAYRRFVWVSDGCRAVFESRNRRDDGDRR